ncbi:MAG: substrate-binding domain-containing protein, partial [Caldilineaceae bacterium]|nr:substrate-binding domain-containing protein [Caldilineaceae bacterium]
ARRDPPTALIAANHVMTLGVVAAVQAAGVRCPQEISLIAFDDLPWLELVSPPLTAVRHPTGEICRCAVERLLAAMDGQSTERNGNAGYPIATLPAQLIERASCARLEKDC